MKAIIFAVFATSSLMAGTIDGVTYNLQSSEVGNGYVDYIYDFSALVSAYSADVVWYGAPADYQIIPTYGEITQGLADISGILYATLAGTIAGSPAAEQYGTDALPRLVVKFQSHSAPSFPYPSLTFTNLVDPPADSGAASATATPEPGTVILTALGLFALVPCRRWSRFQKNIPV